MNLRSDPDRQCADGRRLHQGQRRQARGPARPRARPRASSTSRISSGPTGASRLIGLADTQPDDARRRGFPERGARQSDDLLRRARQRAQRRRGLSHPGRPLRCGAQRTGESASDPPATVAATAAPSAPRTGFAPDTASLTETYAAAARLSPAVAGCRNRAGVPWPVPQHRRPRAGGAAGEFALDVADSSGRSDQACTG